jgi:hypothetical protein
MCFFLNGCVILDVSGMHSDWQLTVLGAFSVVSKHPGAEGVRPDDPSEKGRVSKTQSRRVPVRAGQNALRCWDGLEMK